MKKKSGRETEIKLRVQNLAAIRRRLRALGLQPIHRRAFEDNLLYDTTDHALRNARSILRLRQHGSRWTLTYKGPPSPDPHFKSRPEWETAVSHPATLRSLFAALGLAPVFRYQKYRTLYAPGGAGRTSRAGGEVCLDETPIGNFLELEGSRAWIDRMVRRLGYSRADHETASYATLYQRACQQSGRKPGNMVFAAGRKPKK